MIATIRMKELECMDVGVKFHFAGCFINAKAFDYAAMLFEQIEIFNV